LDPAFENLFRLYRYWHISPIGWRMSAHTKVWAIPSSNGFRRQSFDKLRAGSSSIRAGAVMSDRRASRKARAALSETAPDKAWDRFAPAIFALFLAGLVTLLVLAYAGVPLL
jgi:hypothetical protein